MKNDIYDLTKMQVFKVVGCYEIILKLGIRKRPIKDMMKFIIT